MNGFLLNDNLVERFELKELPFQLKKWTIKILSPDSLDEMQVFLRLFDDFFELCKREQGSAVEILSACPPSINRKEDKFVLGIYDHSILIGILDIIRDYPKKNLWTIGYLLIHPMYRNQNIGSYLIKDLKHSLQKATLRCIVQEQNIRALNFWKKNGFTIVNQIEEALDEIMSITYILESKEI